MGLRLRPSLNCIQSEIESGQGNIDFHTKTLSLFSPGTLQAAEDKKAGFYTLSNDQLPWVSALGPEALNLRLTILSRVHGIL